MLGKDSVESWRDLVGNIIGLAFSVNRRTHLKIHKEHGCQTIAIVKAGKLSR
jgi:hypothetical protein